MQVKSMMNKIKKIQKKKIIKMFYKRIKLYKNY